MYKLWISWKFRILSIRTACKKKTMKKIEQNSYVRRTAVSTSLTPSCTVLTVTEPSGKIWEPLLARYLTASQVGTLLGLCS